jgi:hypothetical protein
LRVLAVALIPLLLVAACGGDGNGDAPENVIDNKADEGDGPAAPEGDDSIRVTIAAGADAGDHERTGVGANCSVGLVDEGVFGVQYSDAEVTEGLSSVQAIVNSETDFSLSATIGPLHEGTTYHIVEGTATVDVEAEEPTLTAEGTTEDGTEVTVVVECGKVFRN